MLSLCDAATDLLLLMLLYTLGLYGNLWVVWMHLSADVQAVHKQGQYHHQSYFCPFSCFLKAVYLYLLDIHGLSVYVIIFSWAFGCFVFIDLHVSIKFKSRQLIDYLYQLSTILPKD